MTNHHPIPIHNAHYALNTSTPQSDGDTMDVVSKMTTATIELWDKMKMRMVS